MNGERVADACMVCTLVVVQALAVMFAGVFYNEGVSGSFTGRPVTGTGVGVADAGLVVYMVLAMVGGALLMLWLVRYPRAVRALIFLSLIGGLVLGFYAALSPLLEPLPAFAASAVLAMALGFAVARHPEWYVLDLVGLLLCSTVGALIGVSLPPLGVLVVLAAFATYDYYMVYRSDRMVRLAGAAMSLRLPMLFAFPRRRDYSYTQGTDGALLLGYGDAAVPAMLAASAGMLTSSIIPPLGVAAGTALGAVILLRLATVRRRPQAGLPFLCSGAALGFVVACLAAGVRFW